MVAAVHADGTRDRRFDTEDLLAAIVMLGTTMGSVNPRPSERYRALVVGGLARPGTT